MSTTGHQPHRHEADGWPPPTSAAGRAGLDPGEETLDALFPLPPRPRTRVHGRRFPVRALPVVFGCFLVTAVPVAVLAAGLAAGILVAVVTGLAAATCSQLRGPAAGLVVGATGVLAASMGVSWPAWVLAASALAVGVTWWRR